MVFRNLINGVRATGFQRLYILLTQPMDDKCIPVGAGVVVKFCAGVVAGCVVGVVATVVGLVVGVVTFPEIENKLSGTNTFCTLKTYADYC